VGATFRIKAPIFVARQLVKHQVGLVWNEVSRRYVDEEPEFFLPSSWRGRPEGSVKQGSSLNTVDMITLRDQVTGEPWHIETDNAATLHVEESLRFYQSLLRNGVAPEQARMVLPQNTMTEWIWTGSLMAFARIVRQRTDAHAQQETQTIAQQIEQLLQPAFPVGWAALMENK